MLAKDKELKTARRRRRCAKNDVVPPRIASKLLAELQREKFDVEKMGEDLSPPPYFFVCGVNLSFGFHDVFQT